MNTIRSWAVLTCTCCIACSVISVILPMGRMRKTINLILGLFLLCSMLVPLVGAFAVDSDGFGVEDSGISFDVDSDIEMQSKYDSLVLTQTADNLVTAANDLLLSNDIEAKNIKIGIKKSDDNSIYISSIYIYITKEQEKNAEDIKSIIGSNMSKEPVIIISEE